MPKPEQTWAWWSAKLRDYVWLGLTLLAIANLGGMLGGFWWGFDLLSHFQVQFAFAATLALILSALFRCRKIALVSGLLLILPLTRVLSLYVPVEPRGNGADSMKVLVINVNSSTGDPERVREFVMAESPDLLIVQEVTPYDPIVWKPFLIGMPHRLIEPRGDNFGIAVYSRYPGTFESVDYSGIEIPSIRAELNVMGRSLQLIATHPLPPVGSEQSRLRDAQLQAVALEVDPQRATIVAGDFNASPWSSSFRQLMKQSGLRNSMQGFGPQASWPQRPLCLRTCIDHLLHSDDLVTLDRRIGPDVGSDHRPVIIELAWTQ